MSDLNLARKWRPKTFNQIVGQQISVRMLLNSLFLNKLFPVYLFTGLRGCGKTSTARVFGAAVNCQELKKFQLDPDGNKIPCLNCHSCKAFSQSSHPDFIEIDAASHTGVDNVRQIIESSSYMPLLGQKKIYLIDEAHMLSKSAFNALLKILEEPPASVLFILATTEVNKIPETVLSRCFQVMFTSLESTDLRDHLRSMCTQESISIEDFAIDLIISETGGSVRDAINLLERVRFSDSVISQATVLKVLGKISVKELLNLFSCLIDQDARKLLSILESMNFESISAQNLWDMLVELCRALLWIKYGIKSVKGGLNQNIDELILLSSKCSLNRLHAIFQLLWTQEELFLRTSRKHIFLEMVLLQICEQTTVADVTDLINMAKGLGDGRVVSGVISMHAPVVDVTEEPAVLQENSHKGTQAVEPDLKSKWDSFLQKMDEISDPMLSSIFKQAVFVKFDVSSKKIDLQLNNGGRFFKEKVEETRGIWLPKIQESFGFVEGVNFIYPPEVVVAPTEPIKVGQFSEPKNKNISISRQLSGGGEVVNVKDSEKWPLANLIISHFPGTIKKSGVDD
jgi:DNA polymerase-3 subunit gamma/tau